MTKEGRPDEIPSARQFGVPLFAPPSPAWTNEQVSDNPVGRSPDYGKMQVSAIDGMTPLDQDGKIFVFFLTLQRLNDLLDYEKYVASIDGKNDIASGWALPIRLANQRTAGLHPYSATQLQIPASACRTSGVPCSNRSCSSVAIS